MLQVLDLLTSQMSGASTLGQMRVARDALMQHEDPTLTHLASSHSSLLDAGGVELEDRKRLWEILERETGVTYPLL